MKNLAIIIGIDKYQNASDLIACKNDAEIVYEIINKSKKYEDIIYINGENDHRKILKELEELKLRNENDEIGEIFFYFSGHGHSEDNELYYITSNTIFNKINSTSLKNSEMDILFRTLKPSICVKIIDACQSGISYIKDIDDGLLFQKAMNETKKEFEKCFFMFSSLKTQSSYVMEDNEMSYFTNSLVEALKNYNNQEYVKYSEISNYMADYFKNIGKQTPFFVTQTDMLDKFIDYNEEVVNFLQNINKQEIEKNKDTNETLKTQIEKKLELCATKDEAKELIDTIIDNFNFFSIDDKIINEYFEVKKEIDINLIELPNKKNIANWIYENKSELNLFAKTKLEELHKSKFYSSINLSETLYGNDKESNYEFEIMEKDFLNNIRITFTPKSLGLEKYEMDIVIVPSFSKLYVFLTFINNIPITWGDFQYDYMNEWSMKEFNIKSEINVEKFVKETYENFIKFCMDNLENMLGK